MSSPAIKRLAGALADAGLAHRYEIAEAVQAVVREEIERAKPSDKPPPVAPVSGEPGGVRVVWTAEARVAAISAAAEAYVRDDVGMTRVFRTALPHLRVEVDQDTLEEALIDAYNYDGTITEIVHAFTRKLGIHLSDGGSDEG